MTSEPVERKNILFVGEGEFSFAANYILNSNSAHCEQIYATCLTTGCLTVDQEDNINLIQNSGGIVYTDVDATKLEHHPYVMHLLFSKIIFNFPHVEKKMNIRDNRLLVQKFFISAVKVLEKHGTVIVSLCQGQGGTEMDVVKREWCNTWQICSLAASASLILSDIKSFDAAEYGSYKCTGYRGFHKPFNTKGALTHFFCLEKSVEIKQKKCNRKGIFEEYVENCTLLFKKLCKKLDNPSSRIISFLHDVTDQKYPSNVKLTVPSLFICRKLFSNVADSSVVESSKHSDLTNWRNEKLNICSECINSIIVEYLLSSHDNESIVTSVISTACCIQYFDALKLPFFNTVSYFVNDVKVGCIFLAELVKNLNDFFCHELNVQSFFKTFDDNIVNLKKPLLSDYSAEISIKQISTLYAHYSLKQFNSSCFYSNIVIAELETSSNTCNWEKFVAIGNVFEVFYKSCSFLFIILNTDLIACLKFHIFDYRTLFIDEAYFTSCMFYDFPQVIYKTKSISPPFFSHDTSFWINEDFSERNLFFVARNTVGFSLKDIVLIDSYYHPFRKQFTKCYRFIYQSCNKALSKEKAWEIHTNFMRNALEMSLKVKLR